jgi:hypothetical protein
MSASLFEAALDHVRTGRTLDQAFEQLLDAFFLAPTDDMKFAVLAEGPPLTGDPRLDALAGAVAEYLANQQGLPRVPSWASDPARILDRPWHMCATDDFGMRSYLSIVSPAEFRSHNVFTEERPLRWGRSGRLH